MAKAGVNKKMGAIVDLPECPVCLETMSAPIYNCQSGHSLCSTCTSNLCPSICPMCRQPMTTMRNRALEAHISSAKVSCPNKGCKYTVSTEDVENHLKECIFREMTCPVAVFGKCSWKGTKKSLLEHFKEHHPQNCDITANSEIELVNISVANDDRHVYLITQDNMLFILTVKIDSIVTKMSYWIVQHIGTKKEAQQHVYEISITSKQDNRRKVTFNEVCFNDVMKSEEIFRKGKCGMMPLTMLSHFIMDGRLCFRFSVNKIYFNPKQNYEKRNANLGHTGPTGSGPRGPRPRGPGPQGFKPRTPGPHNIRNKSPNPHMVSKGPKGEFKTNHPFMYE